MINIKCEKTPLHKLLSAFALNSKVNNSGTESASMNHVNFEHIKDKGNILADSISYLRSIQLYDSLNLEGEARVWT